jgi:hypothetical protein
MSDTPLLHAIEVRFLGPTATKGAQINLNSLLSFTGGDVLTIFYNRSAGSWLDHAVEVLKTAGFEIVGVAEGADCYYIITSTFKPLRGES